MSYNAKVIQVLIASPSDVLEERRIAREAVHEWNSINAKDRKTILVPLTWENDSTPESGERPQESLNRQLLRDADLLIAIFWTRIGSPTGKSPSGTVEEIEEHIKAGKTAMLYFSSAPVVPDALDSVQYGALQEFKAWAKAHSLYQEYVNSSVFGQTLHRHLAQTIISKFAPVAQTTDAPQPTVKERLPQEALELLIAAAREPSSGSIVVLRMANARFIRVGRHHFGDPRHPKIAAIYRGALKKLQAQGLIEPHGGNGEIYNVTDLGYQEAENVAKEEGISEATNTQSEVTEVSEPEGDSLP